MFLYQKTSTLAFLKGVFRILFQKQEKKFQAFILKQLVEWKNFLEKQKELQTKIRDAKREYRRELELDS